jgi:DNA-binding response OmpR family regulator
VREPGDIKILIVEDDPYFQRVLHKRLINEGYQVGTAADGREGMKAIVSWDPDLVISDWMMPHVDGLELCQSVKTGLKEAAPYFILLTAKGEISDRLLAIETGADDYLVKPCDQGELMARVRAGLRNVVMARELRQAVRALQTAHAELDTTRAEIRDLTGRLSSCLVCKKIRSAEGDWLELHDYLARRGLLDFGPAICPDCDSGSDTGHPHDSHESAEGPAAADPAAAKDKRD